MIGLAEDLRFRVGQCWVSHDEGLTYHRGDRTCPLCSLPESEPTAKTRVVAVDEEAGTITLESVRR